MDRSLLPNCRRLVHRMMAGLLALAGLAVPAADTAAQPAGYPGSGRVTFVVPFAPGGISDG